VAGKRKRKPSTAVEQPFDADARLERGLLTLAAFNGSGRKAERFLASAGERIPRGTMERWRERHADRYAEIRRDVLPQVRAQAADEHRELAALAMDAERKLAQAMGKRVSEIPPRDLPGAVRNAATSAGIHTQRAEEMDTDAPAIRVSADFGGLLAELKTLGVEVIEGDAEEIEGTEVVSLPDGGGDKESETTA
jgi:hypothetical protein